MRLALTRSVVFHATHHYYRPEWSSSQNLERFGYDKPPQGHGHLYRVEITISGTLDPETSMLVDLQLLDQLIESRILAILSGQDLNQTIAEVRSGKLLPTCETLVGWCWQQLFDQLPPGVTLERIAVAEDDSLRAESLPERSYV